MTQVNWNNPDQRISKYFSVREVTNGDSMRIPTNPEHRKNILALAGELDKIREEWRSPILITSWYRPPAINRAIGGVRGSQHTTGKAADIRPVNPGDLHRFQSWIDSHWSGALGYGAERGFVHIDMRNNKGWKNAGEKGPRWNY